MCDANEKRAFAKWHVAAVPFIAAAALVQGSVKFFAITLGAYYLMLLWYCWLRFGK